MPKFGDEDSIKAHGGSARSIVLNKPVTQPNKVDQPALVLGKQAPKQEPKKVQGATKPKEAAPLNLQQLIDPVKKPIQDTLLKLELQAAAVRGREGPKTITNKPIR